MQKEKQIRVTRVPQDIIQQLLVSPEEMLSFLVEGAVELYFLGVTEEINQPDVFRNAMRPLAVAWCVEEELVKKALAVVTEKCKAIDESENTEETSSKVPGNKRILAIFATLTDTIVWLERREDRLRIAELLYFLKDFWDIEGSLT